LTYGTFVVAGVFFRAPNLSTAWRIITAMVGLGDAPVAKRHFQIDDWMIRHGYISDEMVRTWLGDSWSVVATLWTALALLVILAVPDTMEITDYREGDAQSAWRRSIPILAYRPSIVGLGTAMVIFLMVFYQIGHVSEFLYYHF
jgi:hypothetical protein